jgi:hypothetical protein
MPSRSVAMPAMALEPNRIFSSLDRMVIGTLPQRRPSFRRIGAPARDALPVRLAIASGAAGKREALEGSISRHDGFGSLDQIAPSYGMNISCSEGDMYCIVETRELRSPVRNEGEAALIAD